MPNICKIRTPSSWFSIWKKKKTKKQLMISLIECLEFWKFCEFQFHLNKHNTINTKNLFLIFEKKNNYIFLFAVCVCTLARTILTPNNAMQQWKSLKTNWKQINNAPIVYSRHTLHMHSAHERMRRLFSTSSSASSLRWAHAIAIERETTNT